MNRKQKIKAAGGVKIANRELAEELIRNGSTTSLYQFVISKFQDRKINTSELKKKITLFALKFTRLWNKSCRKRKRFFEHNKVWLSRFESLSELAEPKLKTKKGRPPKSFETSSTRSKLRKVHDISVEVPYVELMFAAATSATNSGHRDVGRIIKELSECAENVANLKQSKNVSSDVEEYSPTEALAFICKNGFSKSQYKDIRASTLQKGCNLYPSYQRVLEEKKLTYPEGITIKPSAAEVPLQTLIDHTNVRLIESQKSALAGLSCDEYKVKYKWGCDGSSNHARYKQNFFDEDEDGELVEYNDSHIFSIALVPLQLSAKLSEQEHTVVWNNNLPSSVSLCRPIKLIFSKETSQLTQAEVEKVREQILNLKPTEIFQDGRKITVYSTLILSMMDTKVINDLTGTHSQACSLCGKSGKKLNDAVNQVKDDPEKFCRGFSPLHAYIRTMELFLKVSYRLEMEKPTWRVSKSNQSVRHRETTIRSEIKQKLGLRISEPLPSGGNSNDGNTARKFFKEWRVVCEITGLNEELLERIYTILVVINSKQSINAELFHGYLETTRQLYVSHYGWYPLSPTLHKVLIHGSAIVKHCIVPVGMLSEEALETRNKSIRRFREFHSRKFSRIANIEDVFNRLLLTSDPVISLMNRKSNYKADESLPEEALKLLIIN